MSKILNFLILILNIEFYFSYNCKPGYSGKYCDECGVKFQKTNVRIVGGKDAVPNSWPWTAFIYFNYRFEFFLLGKTFTKTISSYCGGSLIDRQTVLTASHCFLTDHTFTVNSTRFDISILPNSFYPTFESMYTVYLGMHNITGIFDKKSSIVPGMAYAVKKFVRHPRYDLITYLNDIAIIELVNEVKLNENVQIACLPDENFKLKTDIPAWIVGWGSKKEGGDYAPVLQNVKITIYNPVQCNKILNFKNWAFQICAGDVMGGKDTCQGDSGGPLMIKNEINNTTKYILIGLTSYGVSCGRPQYPGIYTRISAFLEWINLDKKQIITTTKPAINTLPNFNCSSKNSCNRCGLSIAKPNVRIYGGKEAVPYSWPSMVLITFNFTHEYTTNEGVIQESKLYSCGGSLIDNRTVLTAANCYTKYVEIFDYDKGVFQKVNVTSDKNFPTIESRYTVYLGLHDKRTINGDKVHPPTIKMSIQNFIIHPKFNSSNYLNDIAIIKLSRDIEFNQYIQPACLPKFRSYPRRVNISTWAAGWGTTSSNSELSKVLHNVKMRLFKGKMCRNVYPKVVKDWKRQICSGYNKGGKDTCKGDSGGPLFVRGKMNGRKKFILVGITSYGEKCGTPGFPGIYTKVSFYLNWIKIHLNNITPRSAIKLTKKCSYGQVGKYCDECGKQFYKPNIRIVGGKEAVLHSWPSTVLIRFRYNFVYSFNNVTTQWFKSGFCSGSLIDRRTVLTVAHCFFTRFKLEIGNKTFVVQVTPNTFHQTYESMYTIYLGLETNSGVFDGATSLEPGIAMSVDKFIIHPNYTSSDVGNDIAVIKLVKELELNNYIQPACLPNPKFKVYPRRFNIPVWASGWGTLSQNGPIPKVLHNVKMTLYNRKICGEVVNLTAKNWEKLLCAGEYKGGKDTCLGDSGGPLFVRDNIKGKMKYVLVGLTSYGTGCGLPKYPGIYTKLSAFLSWISLYLEKK